MNLKIKILFNTIKALFLFIPTTGLPNGQPTEPQYALANCTENTFGHLAQTLLKPIMEFSDKKYWSSVRGLFGSLATAFATSGKYTAVPFAPHADHQFI